MESNRLYPDLDPFYKSGSVEYGAELLQEDESSRVASEHKPHRHTHHSRYPSLPHSKKDETTPTLPITPSAPPPSEGGRSLLDSLHSMILEGLEPPPYSPKDPLSSDDLSWIDDLQPDYDISFDDEEDESHQILHLTEFANAVDRSKERRETVLTDFLDTADQTTTPSNSDKVQCTNKHDQVPSFSYSGDMVIVRNRQLEETPPSDGGYRGCTHGIKNNEYGNWVTWRKNVNRQLATVILLRRGGNVHLQKSDLSRRPLSRTSMNYVIRNARNKYNTNADDARRQNALSTSLNGTPYIMYGIPRVVLAKPPPERN